MSGLLNTIQGELKTLIESIPFIAGTPPAKPAIPILCEREKDLVTKAQNLGEGTGLFITIVITEGGTVVSNAKLYFEELKFSVHVSEDPQINTLPVDARDTLDAVMWGLHLATTTSLGVIVLESFELLATGEVVEFRANFTTTTGIGSAPTR